jgi:radical SAM superfamily enzyme YgiQ (UPF0313 family)
MRVPVNGSKTKVYPVLVSRRDDSGLFADGASLPMGTLVSYAKVYKDGLLNKHFEFERLVNRQQSDWGFYLAQAEKAQPAVWLLSSYMWNHKDNMALAEAIKERSPKSLILAGGPHIPAYAEENHAFLHQHPFVDITVRGEGEITLAEILDAVASNASSTLCADFNHINGITFLRDNQLVRTADRVRNRHLDIFPSAYLTGEFDHESFNDLPGMILETNRGCPFGCTFCDWGSATLQKFSLFNLERVKKEIDIVGQKRSFSIYLGDSNFGVFERDVEIAHTLVETKRKYGFPKKFNSSFAKNASPRLAEIIKILKSVNLMDYGLISIQTTDRETLSAINRSNIKNNKYDQLIEIFKEEGLQLSSELLIGLPGQTVHSHKEDLQFFIDRKLMTIAYNTAVMPNAPMNEPGYRQKYKIVTDENDYVISTSTFNESEYQKMFQLYLAFQFFYVLGVLKYFLYCLQMDYSIRMMDFIDDLLKQSEKNKEKYPLNFRLQKELLTKIDPKRIGMPILHWKTEECTFIFNHLDDYYKEIILFTEEQYGIHLHPSEVQTLMIAQKSVMPALGKTVPLSVDLDHDLVAYFEQIKKIKHLDSKPENFRALINFPKGKLTVRLLKNKTIDHLNLVRYHHHSNSGWELKSALRF